MKKAIIIASGALLIGVSLGAAGITYLDWQLYVTLGVYAVVAKL